MSIKHFLEATLVIIYRLHCSPPGGIWRTHKDLPHADTSRSASRSGAEHLCVFVFFFIFVFLQDKPDWYWLFVNLCICLRHTIVTARSLRQVFEGHQSTMQQAKVHLCFVFFVFLFVFCLYLFLLLLLYLYFVCEFLYLSQRRADPLCSSKSIPVTEY